MNSADGCVDAKSNYGGFCHKKKSTAKVKDCCVDLEVRDKSFTWECKVCSKVLVPAIMQSHSDNMGLLRRK